MFITLQGKYDPQFKYRWIPDIKHDEMYTELSQIKTALLSPDIKSELKLLFLEKIEELFDRLALLKAYKLQDFDNILKYNSKLFGEFNPQLLAQSKEKIFSNIEQNESVLGKPLSLLEIEKAIEKHLLDR